MIQFLTQFLHLVFIFVPLVLIPLLVISMVYRQYYLSLNERLTMIAITMASSAYLAYSDFPFPGVYKELFPYVVVSLYIIVYNQLTWKKVADAEFDQMLKSMDTLFENNRDRIRKL